MNWDDIIKEGLQTVLIPAVLGLIGWLYTKYLKDKDADGAFQNGILRVAQQIIVMAVKQATGGRIQLDPYIPKAVQDLKKDFAESIDKFKKTDVDLERMISSRVYETVQNSKDLALDPSQPGLAAVSLVIPDSTGINPQPPGVASPPSP